MPIEASRIDRILKYTKDWDISFISYSTDPTTLHKVMKVRRQDKFLEIETDCSIEYLNYELALENVAGDFNSYSITMDSMKILFSNYVDFNPNILGLFSLLGIKHVFIVKHKSILRANRASVAELLTCDWQDTIHSIENPEYSFEERRNMFL